MHRVALRGPPLTVVEDLVVLDRHSTPLVELRMRGCRDVQEALFVQMILGDDRAVRETWVAGTLRHARDAGTAPC